MITQWEHERALPRVSSVTTAKLRALAYWLAVVFIFMVPWEAAIHVGFGRLSKAIGFVAGAMWLASVVASGRLRRPDAYQKAFFLFLIWNGITFFWSLAPGATFGGFSTYTQLFGMLLVLWDLFDTRTRIRTGVQAYVLGAFIPVGSILTHFVTEAQARFPAHQRFAGLGYEVDGIALIIAIAAPAAWYLAAGHPAARRSHLITMVNYGYVPVALFALSLTGTRGAVLASIPTGLFMLGTLLHATGSKRLVAFVALVGTIVIVNWFSPPELLERIGSAWGEITGQVNPTGQWGEGNVGGRTDIWMQSLQAFSDHPIGGVGLEAHRVAVPIAKVAHNAYLSVLAETGIVGFFLFAAVLLAIWSRVRRLSGRERRYWFTQLAVIAIGAMSLSVEDSKSVWIFVTLAVASALAVDATAPLPTQSGPTPTQERASHSPGNGSSSR